MAREYVDILLAEESGEVSVPLRVGGSMRMEQIGISRADALKKLAEKSVDPQFVIEQERKAATA